MRRSDDDVPIGIGLQKPAACRDRLVGQLAESAEQMRLPHLDRVMHHVAREDQMPAGILQMEGDMAD